jgi:tripartite-type tricarboxylate transporter receptor subunit TctC
MPDVRPLSETGLPGFEASIWFMVMAPAKTPAQVVATLHREINAVLAEPDVRKKIVDLGAVVSPSPPPAELAKFVDAEIARWGRVVKGAGLENSI